MGSDYILICETGSVFLVMNHKMIWPLIVSSLIYNYYLLIDDYYKLILCI